jgi:hypothetical protein
MHSIWSWAQKHDYVSDTFAGKGLRFRKTEEKPRFQTWHEIDYQIKRGAWTITNKMNSGTVCSCRCRDLQLDDQDSTP